MKLVGLGQTKDHATRGCTPRLEGGEQKSRKYSTEKITLHSSVHTN
jgi:hypothetical protein